MKKIVLSSILAANLLIADDYKYEIAPMVGYVDTHSKTELENHKMFGLGAYRNLDEDCKFDQLELALLHGNDAEYENSNLESDTNILMANAVKEYKIDDTFGLYALAGLGYHQIKDEYFGDDSEGFFDYGVGAKIKLAQRVALKLDARHMLRFDGGSNILYTMGLAIALGEKSTKKAPVKRVPKAVPTPPKVSKPISKNSDDDEYTVIVKPVDLGVVFDTDSAQIKSTDLEKFEKFVAYAKKLSDKTIIVEAHTDDVGSEKYNKGLSHRRAMSAKKQLISMGIDEKRIITKGYGETRPKVPNTSAENRQINRRVEAKIVE